MKKIEKIKTIVYLMNLEWNGMVKARPHFIAEELFKEKGYKIILVNHFRYSRKGYQRRDTPVPLYQLRGIPRMDRYGRMRCINNVIKKVLLSRILKKHRPDYIYLTHPLQYDYLPKYYRARLVYDCMDDYHGLARERYRKYVLVRNERRISREAEYLIFSSAFLKKQFIRRYGLRKGTKTRVVRNAFDGKIYERDRHKEGRRKEKEGKLTLCYVGTISHWFDFSMVQESLRRFPEIEYLFVGLLREHVHIPEDPRIRYLGTVGHEELSRVTEDVDCFVMPFLLSDAIRAVDPIKLYEYINFGRNILCVAYEEVERFKDFVLFYNTAEEYCAHIEGLLRDRTCRYTQESRVAFLRRNTWQSRKEEIVSLLDNI